MTLAHYTPFQWAVAVSRRLKALGVSREGRRGSACRILS